MIKAACIEDTDVSNISFRERGQCTNIRNEKRLPHLRVKVDGCIDVEGLLADWVIERGDQTIVIELKGRHVEHAAKQIFATAELWKSEGRFKSISGLIVGKQTPGANTAMQLQKAAFAKKFRGPLHVVKSECHLDFQNIFSFKGPHKC